MLEIVEMSIEGVQESKDQYILVDVREPDELTGPEGHIDGVILAPLGRGLTHFLTSADPQKKYVFVCRSGYRSAQACAIAYAYGFPHVYNLKGGMLAWNGQMNEEIAS